MGLVVFRWIQCSAGKSKKASRASWSLTIYLLSALASLPRRCSTARTAFEAGACVLFGHCEEDLATPYQLFAEALRHFVIHAPEDQLLDHIDEYGSELSRLVPALASRIPKLPPSKATDSDPERYLLFASPERSPNKSTSRC